MLPLLLAVSCRHKSAVSINPDDMGSDRKMYETASRQIGRNPEKARMLFKEVMQLYPESVYALRSKLGIADSYFREKDSASLLLAASEYQEFVSLYPYSPDAVYAKYQIGACHFQQVRKPGRDQSSTFEAIKAFEQMIQQYPESKEAEQAKTKIAVCRQNLAQHYFRIGVANFRMGAYRGAVDRFKQVIDEYPEFTGNDRLYYYAGRSYFAMRDYDSAASFFQRVATGFPKSKQAKSAAAMLKKTAAAQAAAKKRP
jgi:outer membrane protein assembly factor BamD